MFTAISTDLNEKLVALCQAYGMTKSGLIAYYVGKMVDQETRVNGLISQDSFAQVMSTLLSKQIQLAPGEQYPDLELKFPVETED